MIASNPGFDGGNDESRRQLEDLVTAYSALLEALPEDLGLGPIGSGFADTWRTKIQRDLLDIQSILDGR